ncbi:MAG: hypothetical protein Q9184_006973 [Pyrenodesmia sp. 2 TL-2023]
MSSTVVHVKNIAPQTSEKEVRDFFSFWYVPNLLYETRRLRKSSGKITSLSVTPASEGADSPQSATVTFEKETAAKTALLLDNTQLGSSQVQVSSAANLDDLAGKPSGSDDAHRDENDISQEDKPRSRIVAEYLAHGYVISDNAIQRAIALDNKHGVSNRFTNALANFDSKYHATDRAKGIDASYGITEKASRGWAGLSSYFEKAVNTPTGQKLAAFYTQSDKQVRDIHAEARRLADLKAGKSGGDGNSGGDSKEAKEANAKTMEQVPGTDKTTCQCGGDTGACPCGEGKCACSGCAKSGLTGEKTATGPADEIADSSKVQPLGEKTNAPSRASHQSIPSLRRTYASGPLERFQNAVSKGVSNRIFKKGEADEISDQQKEREPAPSSLRNPTPPIDDSDYTPALSGEGLESIGGPTGWWEQAWDEEHQFQGFMRATPLRDRAEVESAIGRALVEAVLLSQEPRGSQLRSAIERALEHVKTTKPGIKPSKRLQFVMNQPRPLGVPTVDHVNVRQPKDGEIRLHWRRQEDKELVCSFLSTSLEENMEKENLAVVDRKSDVEDGQEESGEETTLSQLEADDPVQVAKDPAVDIDEPPTPRGWNAPENTVAVTEQGMATSTEQVEEPAVDSRRSLPGESADTTYTRIRGAISLSDPELKFAVVKRAMQLLGTRIPDPNIQAIKTTDDLQRELGHEVKPKKLADQLVEARRPGLKLLKSLPNVKILPTRYKPFMAEGALGRQKVIEKRLEEYGIEEPWKDVMERIEEHERSRLLKLGKTVAEGGRVPNRPMDGDTLDHAIVEDLDLQTLNPNPTQVPTTTTPQVTTTAATMSAPNAGRQSPEPEKQTDAQAGKPESGKVDAAPSAEHAQEKSEDAKENVLSSNPKGPLEDAAHEKVSKEGRGDV